MESFTCENCGHVIETDSRHWIDYGNWCNGTPSELFCPKCGSKVPIGATGSHSPVYVSAAVAILGTGALALFVMLIIRMLF